MTAAYLVHLIVALGLAIYAGLEFKHAISKPSISESRQELFHINVAWALIVLLLV